MIAVIFEVMPNEGLQDDYFERAAALKEDLSRIEGFISVERFASLTTTGKFLSLSFWQDEDAVARWRTHAQHRDAQSAGREKIFSDYRIRVAHVVRDYGLHEREHAPRDSQHAHI
jgi:heme-degrading monooxygenase HmoA